MPIVLRHEFVDVRFPRLSVRESVIKQTLWPFRSDSLCTLLRRDSVNSTPFFNFLGLSVQYSAIKSIALTILVRPAIGLVEKGFPDQLINCPMSVIRSTSLIFSHRLALFVTKTAVSHEPTKYKLHRMYRWENINQIWHSGALRSTPMFSPMAWTSEPHTDDVISAVRRLPDKLSAADPFPVNMLKQITGELALYSNNTFNCSLAGGLFPKTYKTAYVTPLLKKPGLNATDVRS